MFKYFFRRFIESCLCIFASSILMYLPFLFGWIDIHESKAITNIAYYVVEAILFLFLNFYTLRRDFMTGIVLKDYAAVNTVIYIGQVAAATLFLSVTNDKVFTIFFGYTKFLRGFNFPRSISVFVLYILLLLIVVVSVIRYKDFINFVKHMESLENSEVE